MGTFSSFEPSTGWAAATHDEDNRHTMKPGYWVLNKRPHIVRVIPIAWARFHDDDENRHVAYTEFDGGVRVITEFVGMDLRSRGNGTPLVFASVVRRLTPTGGDFVSRYSCWDDAETGHKATVRRVAEVLRRAMVCPAQSQPV